MFEARTRVLQGPGTTFLLYAGFAVVMWFVRGWVVAGESQYVVLSVLGLVLLGITGRILGNWRSGLYLFLLWLLFEDLVRKYMGNNMAVYFGKDVLVGVVYATCLQTTSREKTEAFRPGFMVPLSLFILLGVAQMFNPGSPNILYGILGVKLYFYYIPLIFVGYALLRDEADLHRFMVANAGLAGLIALVGIMQSSVAGLDFFNPHSGEDIELLGHLTRFTSSGKAVTRPPSVFVSDGRFSSYLILAFIMGVGAAGYLLLRTRRGRILVFPTVALVGLAGMMSGSRGCAVYIAASGLLLSAGMLWGAPPRAAETYRLFKAIRRTFIVVALALSSAVVLFPEAIGARVDFYSETLDPRSPYYEASYRAWDYPVRNLELAFTDPDWPIGHGIGTASLGVQYVGRLTGLRKDDLPHFFVESGYGSMIIELGILGPFLWLVWTLSFMYAAGKIALRVKGTWAFPVALSICWYGFLLLFPFTFGGMQPYQNFVLNAYFWLLAGILFRLPSLVIQDSPQTMTTKAACGR